MENKSTLNQINNLSAEMEKETPAQPLKSLNFPKTNPPTQEQLNKEVTSMFKNREEAENWLKEPEQKNLTKNDIEHINKRLDNAFGPKAQPQELKFSNLGERNTYGYMKDYLSEYNGDKDKMLDRMVKRFYGYDPNTKIGQKTRNIYEGLYNDFVKKGYLDAPKTQQNVEPEAPYFNEKPSEEILRTRQWIKEGKPEQEIFSTWEKENPDDYNYVDAADYLDAMRDETRKLTSDYLDQLYDYYKGDRDKIMDSVYKYNFNENPYVLRDVIENYFNLKEGKNLPLKQEYEQMPFRESTLREAFDKFGNSKLVYPYLMNYNYGISPEELRQKIQDYEPRHEIYDREKSDLYLQNPNKSIKEAYNFLNDNIYEKRNSGLGTEFELAKNNEKQLKNYYQILNNIKPTNRYEASDLENVKSQVAYLIDKISR